MKHCKNCHAAVEGNFCAQCGQPATLERIDRHYIGHEIQHLLHVEKGYLYTFKTLLTRPGQSIRTYLTDNRALLIKPVTFIIVASLAYTIVVQYFHVEDHYASADDTGLRKDPAKASAVMALWGWVQTHYGLANLIMGAFIALWIRVFFRRSSYNLYEIVVLLCYTMGLGMLILALAAALEGLTGIRAIQAGSMVFLAYCTWAIGQFFDKGRVINYVKALAAYLLGMVTFYFLLTAIGLGYDYLVG